MSRRAQVEDQLDELEHLWRSKGARIVDYLAPGISDDQIDDLLGPHGLTPGEEARAWWNWHNGLTHIPETDPFLSHARISYGSWLASLTEALKYREWALSLAREVYPEDQLEIQDTFWRPSMVPLTLTLDPIAVICSVDTGPTPITVWGHSDTITVRVQSLSHMLDLWIWALKVGVTTVQDGVLDTALDYLPIELNISGVLRS